MKRKLVSGIKNQCFYKIIIVMEFGATWFDVILERNDLEYFLS